MSKKKIKPKCKNCKEPVKRNSDTYCSKECYRKFWFKVKIKEFKEGKVLWNSTLRKILIHIEGEICSSCGIGDKWNGGKLTLEVDHIDGNSDNCLPNNLRLLCPNCHSQAPTSKGANKPKKTRRNKYLRKYKGY